MDRNKQEIIDEFLMGNLKGKELDAFNAMLKTDRELARELQFQQEVLESIRDESKLALRSTLNDVGSGTNRKLTIRRFSRSLQLAAAAIVLMLVVGGSFLFRSVFNATDSPQQLYEEFFEPEYDLMTVRSLTSSNDILHQGMNHFASRDYEKAIASFDEMPDNMLGKLYTGFSYMHLEDYAQAEQQFRGIIDNGNNMFVDQAAWHLGLCYLASDNKQAAKNVFTEIANGNTFYKTKALDLLTRMGKN
jgi:tetratricopeptide (TPR) repeat protein